jgi:hypothetical protein
MNLLKASLLKESTVYTHLQSELQSGVDPPKSFLKGRTLKGLNSVPYFLRRAGEDWFSLCVQGTLKEQGIGYSSYSYRHVSALNTNTVFAGRSLNTY